MEHHAFFRLRAPANSKSSRSDFIRLGSRFRFRYLVKLEQYIYPYTKEQVQLPQKAVVYFVHFCILSGRTEYQATHGTRLRRTSTFERRPSKRYPSRRHSTYKGECFYTSVHWIGHASAPFKSCKSHITIMTSVPHYKKKNMSDHLKKQNAHGLFSPEFVVSIFSF